MKAQQKEGVGFNRTEWLQENYQITRRTLWPHLQKLNEVAHRGEMHYFPDCKHTVITVKLSEREKSKAICPTCDTANVCQALQNAATKITKQIMSSMNNMAELDFPDDIITTTLQQSLDKSKKQVSEQLIRDEEFIRFANDSIRYRHLELEKVVDNLSIPTNAEKEKIKGGFYPSDFNHNPKQILRSPDDGTIGVATCWPTGINAHSKNAWCDFAMLDSLSPALTNNQIKEIGSNEMKSIMEFETACRAGAAGGFYIPSLDPIHDSSEALSKACKDQRFFRRTSKFQIIHCHQCCNKLL